MDDFITLKSDRDTGNLKVLEDVFLEFIDKFELANFLEKLISNSTLLNTVANNSYSHINGFDKIILFENENHKLRLHLWNNNGNLYTENIHNHRWNFCSKILVGSYSYENFEINDNSSTNKYYEYEYKPRINEEQFALIYKNETKLGLKESGIKTAGECLSLEHSIPHKIIAASPETTTLFLSGKPVKETTSVFSTSHLNSKVISYAIMDPNELKKRIQIFLSIL